MRDKIDITAKWVLIVGILLTLILPFMFYFLKINFLGELGPLGDAIGGITSPFSQIIGSILIYLALKSQLDANNITQNQIKDENIQKFVNRELEQIHELYLFFENNIKNFSYQHAHNENNKEQQQIVYGRRGIKLFLDHIEEMGFDIHDGQEILKVDGIREILSIMNMAKLILQKIQMSNVSSTDKDFYNTILKHELVFSIFPTTELDNEKNIQLKQCDVCKAYHGNFPPLIFNQIQELKQLL
ncbi:MAG: hypothetical protein R2831_09425 [Chitinophagaceae bacterium]